MYPILRWFMRIGMDPCLGDHLSAGDETPHSFYEPTIYPSARVIPRTKKFGCHFWWFSGFLWLKADWFTSNIACILFAFNLPEAYQCSMGGVVKIHTMDGKPPPATWVVKKRNCFSYSVRHEPRTRANFIIDMKKMMGACAGCKKTECSMPISNRY